MVFRLRWRMALPPFLPVPFCDPGGMVIRDLLKSLGGREKRRGEREKEREREDESRGRLASFEERVS